MEKGGVLMAHGYLEIPFKHRQPLDQLMHTCSPRTWEVESGGQELKIILGYVMSSRPA